jgi:hypothetical protein
MTGPPPPGGFNGADKNEHFSKVSACSALNYSPFSVSVGFIVFLKALIFKWFFALGF